MPTWTRNVKNLFMVVLSATATMVIAIGPGAPGSSPVENTRVEPTAWGSGPAGRTEEIDPREVHREVPGEPAHPPMPEHLLTPPAQPGLATLGEFLSVQVNVDALGMNIAGDAANEPSIAIDPTNPNRIVIGWRQFDTVANNFRQAGWAFSHDGGLTWTFPGVIQPGTFRSDPVLGAGADGTFYYCSLRGDFSVHFFRSFDGGVTWGSQLPAFGGDKQWFTIDRTGGIGHGNIYMPWSINAGCCGDQTFTRSTNGAQSFMSPITVPQSVLFGTIDHASDGTVYVTGIKGAGFDQSRFYCVRSSNAKDPNQTPVFDLTTLVDMGGSQRLGAGPNPAGLLGQANIAVERSNAPTDGYVYMLCSVNPPGSDPLDVMFTRSTDGGVSWSPPMRINDDENTFAWQWFGTMSVAPNGRIDVFFNDTRDDPTTIFSQLYYTFSTDTGLTWSKNEPVSPPFNHFLGYPDQQKLGDYYHSISDDEGVSLAYAATFNGEQDVYYLRIRNVIFGDADADGDLDLLDYAVYLNCVTGPDGDELGPECEIFDSEPDGDVDLIDFKQFQDFFTGNCDITITEQPIDVFACVGDSAVFDVQAEGENLTYQWFHDGIMIPGATLATFTLDHVDSKSAGTYHATVHSACRVTLSDHAELLVPQAPSIETHPVTEVICFGEPAEFGVEASGVQPLGFQWQLDGGDIAGATDSTLAMASVGPEDVGSYRCVVTDDCGQSTGSNEAMLNVPLVGFTKQPEGGVFCSGDNIFLFAEVMNATTFQWFKDDLPIDGATEFFFGILDASPKDSGAYHVAITGMCDQDTSQDAEVTVIDCDGAK